jgi:hypothetical protein
MTHFPDTRKVFPANCFLLYTDISIGLNTLTFLSGANNGSGRKTDGRRGGYVLAISERQMCRLLAKYEDGGGSALNHKARGRTSNRSLNAGIRRYAVELVRTRYADFGPSSATEVLPEMHSLRVGRETLRRWMVAEGLWLSRKQRRTFHQPRLRREHYGELIQIDGSEHRWFEDRKKKSRPQRFPPKPRRSKSRDSARSRK